MTDTNAGPPCNSGRLLHIKLIGTFPRIVHGGLAGAPTYSPVSAVVVTADPVSGKPCLITVETGTSRQEPGVSSHCAARRGRVGAQRLCGRNEGGER